MDSFCCVLLAFVALSIVIHPRTAWSLKEENTLNGIEKTLIQVESADASSVFPSVGANGAREYSPEKACSRGSGYWSSEGNHKSEVVTWTGVLRSRRLVEGISIHWAYAPGKATYEQLITFPHPVRLLGVRIMMKQARNEYFGINLVQLVGAGNPTVRIQSGITSPHQDMCLQMDERGDVVLDGCITSLLAMDGRALWKFSDLGQLYNPVTNKCMVLKDNIDLDGGQIFGQDCEEAYKFNDGRSVWELQPNNQLKLLKGGSFCLSQEGTKAGSSDVAKNKQAQTSHPRAGDTAHSPAAAVDGDSSTYWASQSFSANATPDAVYFEVDMGEKYKLNHLTIAWEYPPMSFTTSISDDGKEYKLIAKESTNSLFTSLVDTKSSVARYLRIALLKPHPTHGKIEEEYLYGMRTLSVYSNRLRSIVQQCGTAKNSEDARDKYFLELVAEVDFVSGNELEAVTDRVDSASTQLGDYLGEIEGIMTELKTCKADKEQARDKLISMNSEYESLSNQLADLGEALFLRRRWISLLQYLPHRLLVENQVKAAAKSLGFERVNSSTPGLTEEKPLKDCYTLKNTQPRAVSGFYYVAPPCSPKAFRAYCDLDYGGTYFVPPDNDGLLEPLDTIKVCGGYGLEPVHLHSASQITSLHRMLRWMELALKHPVPLGVNDGKGYFYSLDLRKEITEYVMSAEAQQMGLPNAVGIATEGLVFFDASAVQMSAIICSTNRDALNPPPSYVDISCSTTVGGNSLFSGPPGTTVPVKCPANCLAVAEEGTQVVGGPEGGYTENSAVCLAAIHSSVLGRDSLVTVRIIEAPEEFEGSDSNGVMSDSYAGPRAARAFRAEPLVVECPWLDVAEAERSYRRGKLSPMAIGRLTGSQTDVAGEVPLGPEKEKQQPEGAVQKGQSAQVGVAGRDTAGAVPPATPAGAAGVSRGNANQEDSRDELVSTADLGNINPATEAAIELLEEMMNMRIGHISPEVIDGIADEANRRRTSQLSGRTQALVTTLGSLGSRVALTLDKAEERLKHTIAKVAAHTAADSWVLTSFNEAEFYDVFEVFNSKTAVGTGSWRMGSAPVGGRDGLNTLSQTAAVGPSMLGSVAVGTYARLKYKKFYDGILSADVYISGSGSVGVAFRMRDFANMFLFELKQDTGKFKRLLRIVDGVPVEVARLEDGGYIEGKWYTVRIEMRQARIKITVTEQSSSSSLSRSATSAAVSSLVAVVPNPDIDILDGRFPSGSIGFFTSGIDAAFFDSVRFDALPCALQNMSPPPEPLTCSTYRELYMHGFHSNWRIVDPESAVGTSQWEFRTNIGGEHKVIAQMAEVSGRDEETPSIAILGGNRGCESGTFSFRILPQCANGLVGGVFKYKDKQNYMLLELGPSFARLRKKSDGVFSTSAKSFLAGFKPGQWNAISITFSGGNVVINAGKVFSPIPVFSILGGTNWQGGAVGLSSWNCSGVAFSDVLLHPLKEPPPPSSPARDTDAAEEEQPPKAASEEPIFKEKDELVVGLQACTNKTHWEDRMAFCNTRVGGDESTTAAATAELGDWGGGEEAASRARCSNNFCDVCCEEEFPLSAKARDTCRQHCHKNDAEAILTVDALQQARQGCVIEESKPLYKLCTTEDNASKCYEEVCEMCCDTNRLPDYFRNASRARSYVIGECKRACASGASSAAVKVM